MSSSSQRFVSQTEPDQSFERPAPIKSHASIKSRRSEEWVAPRNPPISPNRLNLNITEQSELHKLNLISSPSIQSRKQYTTAFENMKSVTEKNTDSSFNSDELRSLLEVFNS